MTTSKGSHYETPHPYPDPSRRGAGRARGDPGRAGYRRLLHLFPLPGDEGPFYIVNAANNRCLDAEAQGWGANGTRVQIWDCYPPTQHNQMWYMHWLTNYEFELINEASGTCLDAPAQWGGIDGTPMQIWDCYPPTQYNQMWEMHPTAQGSWIQGDQSHRVLDVAQNGNGSTVQLLYLDAGIPGELWTLKSPNQF